MGRIQSKGKGKGISSTVTPFKRRCARWVAHTPRSISELIVTMAKKGMSPSQIGVAIRDKEAIPSIKLLTGQKIVRLLKKNGKNLVTIGAAPEIPEDIYCLIKKAVNIRKHM
jgi:small subunit ribosomal protein S13e